MDSVKIDSSLAEEATGNLTNVVSPNQLHEVTSSANVTLFDQTKISPMRGRSVKEYDEQLTALKKENFNLKLRIYFLEERMGSTFRMEDKDSIIRKNIEYQIDLETFRKELDEKQDLLCQAVKALELEDSEHRRIVSLRDTQIAAYNDKITILEQELIELMKQNEHISSEMLHESFEVQTDRNEVEKLRKQLQNVEEHLTEEKEHNCILEQDNHDLECLQIRCKNLEMELKQKNQSIESLVKELERSGHVVSSCNLRIRTMEDSLAARNGDIKYREKEAANRERSLQEQTAEIEELRRLVAEGNALCDKEQRQTENLKAAVVVRDNNIADLESKCEKNKSVIRNLEAKLDTFSHENKRQKDELQTMKSLRNSPRKYVSSASCSRPASAGNTGNEIIEYQDKYKYTKLEEDYKKACMLISNLLEGKKQMEKKSNEMFITLSEKETVLAKLKEQESFAIKMTTVDDEQFADAVQEQQKEFRNVRENLTHKESRIVELETEVTDLKIELNIIKEQLENTNDKPLSWIRVTEEKDQKIEQLESEVRKQTSNLQGIVNKELWDKNREIEKLQTKFAQKLKLKELEMIEVDKQLTSKDMQLKMLKDKISELGIQVNLPSVLVNIPTENTPDIPEEVSTIKKQLKISNEECKYLHQTVEELRQQLRNTPERDSGQKLTQLNIENLKLQDEYEKSEKLRLETFNLCTLLTTRLEELAYFLDSLLKHKTVLGMLGSKQRFAIKQAVDQSLDLSKSLSTSIMNEDQYLAQLSCITGYLNASNNSSLLELLPDIDKSVSLTFNNLTRQRGDGLHNDPSQSEIISILRAQIELMRKEIEQRDIELAKLNMDEAKTLTNDGDLVECIIDLQNKPASNTKASVMSPEKIYRSLIANKSCPAIMNSPSIEQTCSESEAWSEPDRHVSQARIGLDTESLKSFSSKLNRSKSNKSESSESTEDESQKQILQDNLGNLENKLKEKENQILSLKTTILELDNKLLEMKLNMSEEVAKLRNEKIDMEKLLKETEEKFKNYDLNNYEILLDLNVMKDERENALENLKQSRLLIDSLKLKTRELENQLNKNQKDFDSKLSEFTDLKLKEIQDLKNKYESEWISKTEMTEQVAEMQFIYNEIEHIKTLLKCSEAKIFNMEQVEEELKKKLQDSEDSYREKIISLKRELNDSTLRTSQAALERTKINNEKLKIESEIRNLETRLTVKSNEFDEHEKDFNNMKNNLQKQILQAEQQRSSLQVKISELETINAELHNRIVQLQTLSASTDSPPKLSELVTNFKPFGKFSLGSSSFLRQRSVEEIATDNNVFSRTASESLLQQNRNHNPAEAVEARNVTNSSPDLGIESDQGRFSSLETNVITTTRPLLPTLELTASMNNLLSDNDNVGQYCNIIVHKVLEKTNSDLKYKVTKLESELSKINDNKLQIEKAVCKQIHKTSKVLRQARANLDSGSENEKKT